MFQTVNNKERSFSGILWGIFLGSAILVRLKTSADQFSWQTFFAFVMFFKALRHLAAGH